MPSFISSFRSSVILASSRKGRSSIPESVIVASEVRKSCPRMSVTLLHMAMEGGIMTDGRRLTQCVAAPIVITKSRMHIMLLERLLCVMMGMECQVRMGHATLTGWGIWQSSCIHRANTVLSGRLAYLLSPLSPLSYLSICPILYCWSYPLSSATLPSSSV